jgi:hypothetical protein
VESEVPKLGIEIVILTVKETTGCHHQLQPGTLPEEY